MTNFYRNYIAYPFSLLCSALCSRILGHDDNDPLPPPLPLLSLTVPDPPLLYYHDGLPVYPCTPEGPPKIKRGRSNKKKPVIAPIVEVEAALLPENARIRRKLVPDATLVTKHAFETALQGAPVVIAVPLVTETPNYPPVYDGSLETQIAFNIVNPAEVEVSLVPPPPSLETRIAFNIANPAEVEVSLVPPPRFDAWIQASPEEIEVSLFPLPVLHEDTPGEIKVPLCQPLDANSLYSKIANGVYNVETTFYDVVLPEDVYSDDQPHTVTVYYGREVPLDSIDTVECVPVEAVASIPFPVDQKHLKRFLPAAPKKPKKPRATRRSARNQGLGEGLDALD